MFGAQVSSSCPSWMNIGWYELTSATSALPVSRCRDLFGDGFSVIDVKHHSSHGNDTLLPRTSFTFLDYKAAQSLLFGNQTSLYICWHRLCHVNCFYLQVVPTTTQLDVRKRSMWTSATRKRLPWDRHTHPSWNQSWRCPKCSFLGSMRSSWSESCWHAQHQAIEFAGHSCMVTPQ